MMLPNGSKLADEAPWGEHPSLHVEREHLYAGTKQVTRLPNEA
jgi:hypothetical protein